MFDPFRYFNGDNPFVVRTQAGLIPNSKDQSAQFFEIVAGLDVGHLEVHIGTQSAKRTGVCITFFFCNSSDEQFCFKKIRVDHGQLVDTCSEYRFITYLFQLKSSLHIFLSIIHSRHRLDMEYVSIEMVRT